MFRFLRGSSSVVRIALVFTHQLLRVAIVFWLRSATIADGFFEIKNLPAGKHVFRLWHERVGYLRNVRIGSLKTDTKGRLTVTIDRKNHEFPDALLSPKLFES